MTGFEWLAGALLMLSLALTYGWQKSQVDTRLYQPKLAWLRAALYFCLCALIASAAGTFEYLAQTPLMAGAGKGLGLWGLATAVCFAVIVIGYGVIWPRGSFTDERPRRIISQLLYGIAWGLAQGLLFSSLWVLLLSSAWPLLWVAVLAYLCIGTYNGLLHHFFWDIYVSPPHNYSEWNARKVLLCHTPNLLVSLSHLAVFGNLWVFLGLQCLALVLSAWAMRFPAFYEDYHPKPGEERSLSAA